MSLDTLQRSPHHELMATKNDFFTILKNGLTYNGRSSILLDHREMIISLLIPNFLPSSSFSSGAWDRDSFDDYTSVIYWMRQILGLLVGILAGIYPLQEFAGFFAFIFINITIPYFFYTNYSKVNIDDFGPFEMLSEGFGQSFGVFLLSWILVYSGVHFG